MSLGLFINTITQLNSLFVFFFQFNNNPIFDKCAAEFVYLYPSSWGDNKMYRPGTITNSQTMPTKINKNGAIPKVRILVKQMIREGIWYKMPILLLILCWYFNCLQMYLEKFLNIYFHEQMVFQIFVAKGDICQFFWKIIAYEQYIQVSLANLQVSWKSWF